LGGKSPRRRSQFGEVKRGLTIPGKIDKMGYKGVDTTELVFDGYAASADDILGGAPGRGFSQMMDGVEVGRVKVAARACGISIRAFAVLADQQHCHAGSTSLRKHLSPPAGAASTLAAISASRKAIAWSAASGLQRLLVRFWLHRLVTRQRNRG
jgi:alkylation response protein AidB-like acyl-CoA dehydrogenase